jgi:transposase
MSERPTYEELLALVGYQHQMIADLQVAVAGLRAEVESLKAQLAASSRNSSKPPSSDGLTKPAPKSLRGRSGRKPGGQPGHPGKTLSQVTDPDVVVRHEPGACTGCGADAGQGVQVGVEHRQVFDLPPVAMHVTEHQIVTRQCPCGERSSGQAPERVNAPVSYGPRIAAAIVYLYMGQFLSKKRTAQALSDLLGVPLSEGTVASVTARAASDLTVADGFTETVRAQFAAAGLIHLDETGLRVAGRLHWMHDAGTNLLTLLHIHPRRGREAIDAGGVLPGYTGIAMHDAWAPYDTYTTARHVLCSAHLLRELQAVVEHHHDTKADPGAWCWATQVTDSLLALQRLAHDARPAGQSVASTDPTALERHTRWIIDAAIVAAADDTNHGKLASKHRALARRIRDRHDAYLAFTTNPAIPADNNLAERDIRMVKIRQKISGSLRTFTGAEDFAAIRSYTATVSKHQLNLYDALVALATGHPWLPPEPRIT